MARNAAYIQANPNATGDCDWLDLTNNWRDADATWLQERGISRVTTTPDAETNLANTNEGRLFYSTTNKAMYLSTTGAAPFSRILAARALVVDESVAGSAKLGVSGHVAPGISFDTATGNVTIGNLTVTAIGGVTTLTVATLSAGAVAVTAAGGLTIRTDGATTVGMTTGTDGLLLDHGLNANGTVKGTAAQFGALTAAGTSLGATVVSTTLTAGTSVTTPIVTSPAAGDLTIQVQSGRNVRFTAPTIADANFFYGPGSTIRNAWVVVNAVDPGVATVPEGTIWIQP